MLNKADISLFLSYIKSSNERLYNLIQKGQKYINNGISTEADLHIHSTFSDGSFDILQILLMGKLYNLKKIVITDHNTILNGANYLEKLKQDLATLTTPFEKTPDSDKIKFMIKNMPQKIDIEIGCEIACKILDKKTNKYIPIEILAYRSDPIFLQNFIDKYNFSKKTSQTEQLKELMKLCEMQGLVFSKELIVPKGMFATEILCKELIKHEENKKFFMDTHPIVWSIPKLFYKKFCANPTSPFYLDTTKELPLYTDTIDAIISSNGLPFLAHPFLYIYENIDDVKCLLDTLTNTSNIKGFEAYHSEHNTEQIEFIKKYALSKNMLFSGGTDFHNGPRTLLGFGQEKSTLNLTLDMFPWINSERNIL